MDTNPSHHPGLAQVSSSSRLILDCSERGLYALRESESSLTQLRAAARELHAQAAKGELGDVVGLAVAVGRTLEASAPLAELRETLLGGLEELREGLVLQRMPDPT